MSIPSTEIKISLPPLIIYKTYTPQRQAYALILLPTAQGRVKNQKKRVL